MARWKARVEFTVIELLFYLLRLRRYKAKYVKTRCLHEGVGHVEARFQGERVVPCQYIDTTRKTIDCATTLPLTVFGRPFVKRFALCYRSVVLSCLSASATFVHCGQRVGRIKMKLGMQVGLCPGHIGRWGPAPPPLKGHSPPIFGPYLLRPNGSTDQDVTWYGGRPRPRRLGDRWGPRSPSPKGRRAPPKKNSAHVYCGQTAGWMKLVLGMEVGLIPSDFVMGTQSPLIPP